MVSNTETLQRSIQACLRNGERLLQDAEWSMSQASTGLALAMLSQEECAKAFVLALVRDGILPWTDEVRRSLSVHECKNLVTMVMEWLSAVNELRLNESLDRGLRKEDSQHLPPDVAIAMNIYRHEMIERIGRRYAEPYPEWGGRARRVAKGNRDRKKQSALYVDLHEDGGVASEPPVSSEAFEEEFERARKLMEFAGDVDRKCIFAYREYELFADIFRMMFADLVLNAEDIASLEEEVPSGIPGVRLVKRTITVADIVTEADEKSESGDVTARTVNAD